MNNKVEQQIISSDNEVFIRGMYNKINIIIRKKDGFVNATHMCKQFNKKFRKIFENHSWQQFLEEFKREYEVCRNSGEPVYQLLKGVNNEIKGSYVDPRIVNFLAFWASPKYAIHVSKIMDEINKIGQLTHNLNYSNDHLIELQNKVKELEETIQTQDSTINQLMNQTSELQVDQFENSVRTKNNNKYLFIFKYKYECDENIYYSLSHNQKHLKIEHHKHFRFPAAMNIKQELNDFIKSHYNDYSKIKCEFPEQYYDQVISKINSLKPKNILEN